MCLPRAMVLTGLQGASAGGNNWPGASVLYVLEMQSKLRLNKLERYAEELDKRFRRLSVAGDSGRPSTSADDCFSLSSFLCSCISWKIIFINLVRLYTYNVDTL